MAFWWHVEGEGGKANHFNLSNYGGSLINLSYCCTGSPFAIDWSVQLLIGLHTAFYKINLRLTLAACVALSSVHDKNQ